MEHFAGIWKRIVRIDAKPIRTISSDDSDWMQSLINDLSDFARGRRLIVDSAEVEPRPCQFSDAHSAISGHDQVEFVVLFDDGSYWAVTEEEYEYYIYVGD